MDELAEAQPLLVHAARTQSRTDRATSTLVRASAGRYTESELLFALSVAAIESDWGQGFGPDRHNWGAVHCSEAPVWTGADLVCEDPRCFPFAERGAQGERLPLGWCFRSYESPEDGAADFLRELLGRRRGVRAAAASGDYTLAVQRMATQAPIYFAPARFWPRYARTVELVAEELEPKTGWRRGHASPVVGIEPDLGNLGAAGGSVVLVLGAAAIGAAAVRYGWARRVRRVGS